MKKVLVKTGDVVSIGKVEYSVLIADDKIFVLGEKKNNLISYKNTKIFSNNIEINTLEDLKMKLK